jgi:hypothetical protein
MVKTINEAIPLLTETRKALIFGEKPGDLVNKLARIEGKFMGHIDILLSLAEPPAESIELTTTK